MRRLKIAKGRPTSFALTGLMAAIIALIAVAASGGSSAAFAADSQADGELSRPPVACQSGTLAPNGNGGDIIIDSTCKVSIAGTYEYGTINIINGGTLLFTNDTGPTYKVDFWTRGIIIENGGSMIAGSPTDPWGSNGGTLTIHLYGEGPKGDQKHVAGLPCWSTQNSTTGPCGIPKNVWDANTLSQLFPTSCNDSGYTLPGGVKDCFYQYNPLPHDNLPAGRFDGKEDRGYFGNKVIALSYGGTLALYGWKGATYPFQNPDIDSEHYNSGDSWVRLNNCAGDPCTNTPVGETELDLSAPVNWVKGDKVVITSTDYVMSHSEVREIASVSKDGLTVTLTEGLEYPHVAKVFDLTSRIPAERGLTGLKDVDTRAAVGLLTRSIRIVSGGDKLLEEFPKAPAYPADHAGYYYGGHTVYRQGFKKLQLQGVEFYQLGQGGRIAHYPVHFHLARTVPAGTFVKDCSVWDSMTRWYVIHDTSGVTLQRDVGYRSIGHGYYLEDATETNNNLFADLGVSAVAAAYDALNPRRIPGILAAPNYPRANPDFPYHSDVLNPTIFWITNGWNDFQYNMAVGADTCGACYWLVPAFNSTAGRYMSWKGYASEQKDFGMAATTPLKSFIGNTCSTAPNSFSVNGNMNECIGVSKHEIGPNGAPEKRFDDVLQPVKNTYLTADEHAPGTYPPVQTAKESNFYPNVANAGGHFPTYCPSGDTAACNVGRCDGGGNCGVTVLDHYTTSFNFAQTNFAALWLRPKWYLLLNSAITDSQNGGLTFVTGGGYTHSDFPIGMWQLALKDVFIGHTQPQNPDAAGFNPYAEDDGPFNQQSKLVCDDKTESNYCLSKNNGIDLQLAGFSVNQRLYSIYDGPNIEDSNSYLDVTTDPLSDCSPANSGDSNTCANSAVPYGRVVGIPRNGNECYLPNAAIAWKQPNGFYYPPAFRSKNLYFGNVDIRHFVIEPLFKNGHTTDIDATRNRYCTFNNAMWTSFSSVDRQTELTDDDGSLTGLLASNGNPTISVNQDPFFNAPEETAECRSDIPSLVPPGTAETSPYEYVTTVVFPDCAVSGGCGDEWSRSCTNSECFGVPLDRMLLTPGEYSAWKSTGTLPNIRMAGQSNYQRSNLTVNHGVYYVDTTVPLDEQRKTAKYVNAFQDGQSYHVFLLYATPDTSQTYQLFVGRKFDQSTLTAQQVQLKSDRFEFTNVPFPSTWSKAFNPDTGILTVTINNGNAEFQSEYSQAVSSLCQPQSFCSLQAPEAGQPEVCQTNINNTNSPFNYLFNEYAGQLGEPSARALFNQVCQENEQDVDCPEGGCYGFGFRLPHNFAEDVKMLVGKDKKALNPPPSCFTLQNNPSFAVTLKPVDAQVAGDCTYNAPPPSGLFCATPNP